MRATTGLVLAAIVAAGCSGGAGSGQLVKMDDSSQNPKTSTPTQEPPAPKIAGTTPAPESNPEVKPAVHKIPTAAFDPRITYVKGAKGLYKLTNKITIYTQGAKKGELNKETSFLNAMQAVSVDDVKGSSGTVTIKTTDVEGGVSGDSVDAIGADKYIKQTAENIEGSTLQGVYDSAGRGSDLMLLGDGIGLNPMGPQAGDQRVSVGLMGVLLPAKAVKVGDKWGSTYDISPSVQDLFQANGGTAQNGATTIWYTLVDYDKEKNYVKLSISGHGRPLVKIPSGGGTVSIQMDIKIEGEAIVRMDSGWLQQMKVESTVVTEGLAASKQVVNSVTQRVG